MDGDGWVGPFVTRFDRPDALFRNLGEDARGNHLGFEDSMAQAFGTLLPGPRSNGCLFGDVDNDGGMDLSMTKGIVVPGNSYGDPFSTEPSKFGRNDGAAIAESQGAGGMLETGSGKGMLSLDFDQDESLVHIGLGAFPVCRRIHVIRIDWISGQTSVLRNVRTHHGIVVQEPKPQRCVLPGRLAASRSHQ